MPHRFCETRSVNLDLPSRSLGRMKVHVKVYGDGPPLLLVHGLMTSSYSWRYVFGPLGERFTCYAPDLPANGRTDAPLGPSYGPRELATWLGEVQRALGIRGCPVIANSMGGYLAMLLALDDPGAMSHLVNVHSPGVPELRLYALAALRLPAVREAVAWWIRRRPREFAFANVHYFDESLKSVEEAREYGDVIASREGALGLTKYLAETMDVRAIRRFHQRLRARKRGGQPFPVPLLLIYALRDPMVPPRFGRVLAQLIPGARLLWLSRASHFAHVDAPERFVPPVLDFLGA